MNRAKEGRELIPSFCIHVYGYLRRPSALETVQRALGSSTKDVRLGPSLPGTLRRSLRHVRLGDDPTLRYHRCCPYGYGRTARRNPQGLLREAKNARLG